MSQRDSGYARKERDLYETPEWVTRALLPHVEVGERVWEPAAGNGKIATVLRDLSDVVQSDIHPTENLDFARDFLFEQNLPFEVDTIITNPPYNLATEFIEHALRLTERCEGTVAMLLRTDFDHAKSRSHLFRDCPAFAKKVVLTKRIVWFEGGKSPSFNHAWFVWDWMNGQPATIGYAP